MKLVNAAQMRQIDSETISNQNISGVQLMEAAGAGVAEHILDGILEKPSSASVAIFCGKGNNGGDGFVIARYLFEAEVDVELFYLGPADTLSPEAKANFDRCKKLKLSMIEITSADGLPDKLEGDLVVDAIFGTGFEGAPRGLSAELIEYINLAECDIVSVDLPSGLNADTGQVAGVVVVADFTFPLALPKLGLYLSPGRELSGTVITVPIGIPNSVVDKFDITTELITPELVAINLPLRKPDGHKGDFGKLLVIAGSTGMTGAAAMTGQSAYRTGCGIVKIGAPKTVQPILASMLIETMCLPLPDVARRGVLALRALGEIRLMAADADALVVGPGLGLHHETGELVRRLVGENDKPILIDADGLTHIAKDLDCLRKSNADIVLSPHPGEFARLLKSTGTDEQVADDIPARAEQARKFAFEYDVVLVLKGSPTVVASPDGTVWYNQTGNSGMATGGSGDVLSGMIGSFLAQGLSALEASLCSVFLHGLSGDMAIETVGERSLIASDLIRTLPEAIQFIEGLEE